LGEVQEFATTTPPETGVIDGTIGYGQNERILVWVEFLTEDPS
jgi:hypothetical protein